MQKANVNGIELAYRIDGDEARPWLVVSNSLATDHRMWEPQMATLQETHRVLRYDTRGHGESDGSTGPYSLDLLVDDLSTLMDGLGVEAADVLGLSLGGMTGLGLAIKYPERVKRLICCDARADAPQAYAEFWRGRIAVAQKEGLTALVDGTIDRWLTEPFRADPANEEIVALAHAMILSTSRDGFCGCAEALTKLDIAPDLGRIKAPSLFIAGDQDQAAPVDVMSRMAVSVPQGELKVIAGAAHLSNLNQPETFNAAVSEWLAG